MGVPLLKRSIRTRHRSGSVLLRSTASLGGLIPAFIYIAFNGAQARSNGGVHRPPESWHTNLSLDPVR